jgi:hypothetical protein
MFLEAKILRKTFGGLNAAFAFDMHVENGEIVGGERAA